jgi:Na+/H+-translocating membrane pyrophosphatase
MDFVALTGSAWVLGVLGLAVALGIFAYVNKQSPGTPAMVALAEQIHSGAMAFLKREYTVLSVFVVAVAGLLAWGIGTDTAVAYVIGALTSALAGFIGMQAATRANVRTAYAASTAGNQKLNMEAFMFCVSTVSREAWRRCFNRTVRSPSPYAAIMALWAIILISLGIPPVTCCR